MISSASLTFRVVSCHEILEETALVLFIFRQQITADKDEDNVRSLARNEKKRFLSRIILLERSSRVKKP